MMDLFSRAKVMTVKTMCLMMCWLWASVAASEPLKFERSLSLQAAQLSQAHIIAGQGSLTIIGVSGEQINIHAEVLSKQYATQSEFEAEFAERVMFFVRSQDGTAQIMAKARYSMHNTPNIQINVTIELPQRLGLMVDDG